MFRAAVYLGAAGIVRLAEGFLFSRFFGFSAGQTVAAAIFYVALYGVAISLLVRALRSGDETGDLARWRCLSLAPMVVVVLGSFVSLPVMLVILAVGRIV
jgi:uncharacterized membrane protein YhaH (DUF805 family)